MTNRGSSGNFGSIFGRSGERKAQGAPGPSGESFAAQGQDRGRRPTSSPDSPFGSSDSFASMQSQSDNLPGDDQQKREELNTPLESRRSASHLMDLGIDPQASSYYEKGEYPPNCIGYALYTLGIISEEKFFNPLSSELDSIVTEKFDRVPSLEEADVFAVKYSMFFKDSNKLVLTYAHMAVADKQHPGFVTERAFSGGRVRKSAIEDVKNAYPRKLDDPNPEYVYLKLKT